MAGDTQFRAIVDLKLRVWGMTNDGRPFSQPARAIEISATGAVLNKLECPLSPGDVIGLQYENKKARCRIVSAEEHGFLEKIRAEVQLVDGQECPWLAELPKDTPKAAPVLAGNKRRYNRHRISFNLDLSDERVNIHIHTRATDISATGCYVETMQPLPVGTILRIEFWIDSEKVTTSGIVRTNDPGVGMGIEFTGLVPDAQDRFQAYLDQISQGTETLKRAADAGLSGLV